MERRRDNWPAAFLLANHSSSSDPIDQWGTLVSVLSWQRSLLLSMLLSPILHPHFLKLTSHSSWWQIHEDVGKSWQSEICNDNWKPNIWWSIQQFKGIETRNQRWILMDKHKIPLMQRSFWLRNSICTSYSIFPHWLILKLN